VPQANSLARLRLANLLLDLGRFDEAAAEFRKALDADSSDTHALFGMAQLSVARQDPQKALRYLIAVGMAPEARKRACCLRAAVYERLGNREARDIELGRLAEMPEDAPWQDDAMNQVVLLQVSPLARARQLQSQGLYGAAVAVLQKAVQQYPQADWAWAALGTALGLAQDPAGAEKALLKSVELASGNAEYWFYLGLARQDQRLYRAAAAAFHKAIELQATDAMAHFKLGECLEQQGDRDAAAEAFRKAHRFRPDMGEVRERLEKLAGKS